MQKPSLRIPVLVSALVLAGSLVGCGMDPSYGYMPGNFNGLQLGQMSAPQAHAFGYNIARARAERQIRFHLPVFGALPPSVDLRQYCPPIEDQGQLGSCTAFAGSGYREFMEIKDGQQLTPLSQLFLYYNERVAEGTVDQDSGATIQECMTSLANIGMAPLADDPYDISKFTQKPPAQAYSDAGAFKIHGFTMLGNLQDTKAALAQGHPVDIGFTVYQSFENIGSDGMMPVPQANESILGGHSVDVVGYDDARQVLIVRNSWGSSWGDQGYFYMPYAFYTSDNVSEMAIAQ